ncbi:hypothetical protein V6N11_050265 [Hibiscus sabdariffa]|uniref:Uncharacterized protein n=1 Tax=Hibiscus sabdariffa TaxID=183260 RepID=A0ABR2TA76_9ROSI
MVRSEFVMRKCDGGSVENLIPIVVIAGRKEIEEGIVESMFKRKKNTLGIAIPNSPLFFLLLSAILVSATMDVTKKN